MRVHVLFVSAFVLCVFVWAGGVRGGADPLFVHFDIEPASLPEWTSNQQSIINQYLDLLSNITAVKGTLKLAVDTSIAYNFINVTRNGQTKLFYQWIVDYVDVAMMMMYRNYADTPNGIVALTQPTVDYAKLRGKKAISGVETNNEDPAYITFYGTNTTYLEKVLSQVKSAYSTNAGFGGVAVHDYAGYPKLNNSPVPNVCNEKSLFVWDYRIATTAASRSSYFTFAKQRCVSNTYLESEYLVNKDTASLNTFYSTSKTNNMGLHLLYGDATWARTENHAYVLGLVQKSLAFAQGKQ